jgi:hypothetical protein
VIKGDYLSAMDSHLPNETSRQRPPSNILRIKFKMVFPQKQQIARPLHCASPGPLGRSRDEDSLWF